jgi:ADP-ribose pyrophosphatase
VTAANDLLVNGALMSEDKIRSLYRGRVVHLVSETVSLPNGRTTQLEIVRHPGAAAIVPIDADGQVHLIRQFRYAAGGFIYEVPAGTLNPGESPEACAARELVEEAGVRAGRMEPLGSILTTPGFTDEVIHLFLARDLSPAAQNLDHDEVLSVERFPLTRAIEMCLRGELRDAKSMCALLLAERRIAAGES